MAKILDFFRRNRQTKEAGRTFEEILADVQPFSIPALMLRKTNASTKSYLGGDPYLPTGMPWPAKDGKDLTFLASLDLGEVSATAVIPWLPKEGKLLFFYDVKNQPWGFDPKDREGWSVIHIGEIGVDETAKIEPLPKYFVEFKTLVSLPDWQRFEQLGVELDDSDIDTYIDGYFEWIGEEPGHQVGGYPRPVQGDDMELEAQLASNGIYCGDASGYQSEEGRKLAAGAKDWRLLLQFSSDDDLDVTWGDVGDLYFWVKQQDAMKGDFSDVWLLLQCS
jgi:uncharacterized protein YwqG